MKRSSPPPRACSQGDDLWPLRLGRASARLTSGASTGASSTWGGVRSGGDVVARNGSGSTSDPHRGSASRLPKTGAVGTGWKRASGGSSSGWPDPCARHSGPRQQADRQGKMGAQASSPHNPFGAVRHGDEETPGADGTPPRAPSTNAA